jgi:transcriptional regulator with XRE-family HTH domain
MGNRKRRPIDFESLRRLKPTMVREGGKVRSARKRRRWTQMQLGARVGLSQSAVSDLELGDGAALSLAAWQRVAIVLDLPLRLELGRDALEEPLDAGHLGIQELILRLGRQTGRRRRFELASKPDDPSRSTDVGLVDDRHHQLLQLECVNTFGNLGAAARSSDRKRAEAEALAISIGYGRPYTVHQCWVVRATRRNRRLLAQYPETFQARFTGSSSGWVAALTKGTPAPAEPGLVWCDVACTRVFAWRVRVAAR